MLAGGFLLLEQLRTGSLRANRALGEYYEALDLKEIDVSCISAHDPQLARLASAIAQRVGPQRFHVWFDNSTRLDLKHDGLEIAVPNDFISEWIGRNFAGTIQEAAQEVLGCSLRVRFSVVPQLFDPASAKTPLPSRHQGDHARGREVLEAVSAPVKVTTPVLSPLSPHMADIAPPPAPRRLPANPPAVARYAAPASPHSSGVDTVRRLRHDLSTFVVGASNQLAYNAALHIAQFPGSQYNPLFIHGSCGLGKTHLLQGLCRKFIEHHPTKRWLYLTGEEFTNEFVLAVRHGKGDAFRRKMRDLDLLVIDDVHFLSGKKATQEEFLHTFNAIEALGRQVVMASDVHPKMIDEFGESLINRFVSGMVVRIDSPNHATRAMILRSLASRAHLQLSDEVIDWVARRVTQNVRELEGAVTRIGAHVTLTDQTPDMTLVSQALGDLERQLVQPVKPENILQAICNYFGLEMKDLMSGRRQRTISLARSIAMFLIRKTAKLSYPEIGTRMGKRNHSTVISACRRMERASSKNQTLNWSSATGERTEEAHELIQRLEELSRAMN